MPTGDQQGEMEEWLLCFGGRKIITVWLRLRGLQASDEFCALKQTEGLKG